jgi:hypothetical protein
MTCVAQFRPTVVNDLETMIRQDRFPPAQKGLFGVARDPISWLTGPGDVHRFKLP